MEVSPKLFNRPILVFHLSGGTSFSAISIDTNRPRSKSSSASMKSWGILSVSSCKTDLTSFWRSTSGNAFISTRISSAVIVQSICEIRLHCKRPAIDYIQVQAHYAGAMNGITALPQYDRAGYYWVCAGVLCATVALILFTWQDARSSGDRMERKFIWLSSAIFWFCFLALCVWTHLSGVLFIFAMVFFYRWQSNRRRDVRCRSR